MGPPSTIGTTDRCRALALHHEYKASPRDYRPPRIAGDCWPNEAWFDQLAEHASLMLSRLLRSRRAGDIAIAAIPSGMRVYAIGDIHGCLDLLKDLCARIDRDDASKQPAETILIFLGDMIDRGPDSAGVIERLRQLKLDRPMTRFLLGNHEEIFLAALTGDLQGVRMFCRMGGGDTLASYGIAPSAYGRMDYDDVAAALVATIPQTHRDFLANFEDMIVIGGYAFVHAGVDPAVPFAEQKPRNLRWIRQPFLTHRSILEKVVVHGHTVNHEVESHANRIGIDTGAYETGRLSAICLEGTERSIIQTE